MIDFLPIVFGLLFVLAIIQVVVLVYIGKLIAVLEKPREDKESLGLIHKAVKKAGAILGQAELESVKETADTKFYAKKAEKAMEDEFKKAASKAAVEFDDFLAGLSKESGDVVDDALVAFTKRLEEKLTVTEDQLLKQVYDESQKAKVEIAAYKKMAEEKVQADLEGIVNDVAKIVVGKSLSASDQEDLIIEAFEKAKKDKWI